MAFCMLLAGIFDPVGASITKRRITALSACLNRGRNKGMIGTTSIIEVGLEKIGIPHNQWLCAAKEF
jgi:hypothetical protein